MKIELDPCRFYYLDLFPARVRRYTAADIPQGEEFRVIVTDNRVYVLDENDQGPYIHSQSELSSFARKTDGSYSVRTPDGDYFIERADNCGCGARLRGLHPLVGVLHISQYPKND